ncbi:hypothetical protein FHP25_08525 [Vineibacter terrae]|uniref:Uncharacterized protein n=1 Tax=Vineibacter terrae TaxID=2586908 RepID=A0A5C8PR66_9HYPH|nr:hypothetical protein [Vineibacter terrae]TXL78231.1 hypothetical protein FHP25_08525 [Vineibacter terrae]
MLLAAMLSACVTSTPSPAPVVVAPGPKAYTCDQMRRMAAELATLPADAETRHFMADYGEERVGLRAGHRMSDPAPCPAGTVP